MVASQVTKERQTVMNAPPAQIKSKTPDCRLKIADMEYDGDWEYAVTNMPKANCKRNSCYGRGYTGFNKITKQPIMCSCIGYWELLHEPLGGGTHDGPPET